MNLTDTQAGVLQAVTVIATLVLLHIPLGDYIYRHLAATAAHDAADTPTRFRPHWRAERGIYRLLGVDPDGEQNWAQYLRSVLALSGVGILVLYLILRL